MNRLLLTVSLVFVVLHSVGQLKIGDSIPDFKSEFVLNYNKLTLQLADFKDKHIIIDYFGTNCAVCVAELPRMNELQQEFKTQLQIIVVTNEPIEKVKKFASLNKKMQRNSLPIICNDSLLMALFPHLTIPHEVWIDKSKIVKSFTGSEFVNSGNLYAFINGHDLNLPQKQELMSYNYKLPLSANLPHIGVKPSKIYKSLFTTYLPEVIEAGVEKRDSLMVTTYYLNSDVFTLYGETFDPKYWNRTLIAVKDNSRFIRPDIDSVKWKEQNTYCYEISMPLAIPEQERKKLMRENLDFYFGLKTSIENRMVPCWVLKISDPAKLKTGRGDSSVEGVTTENIEDGYNLVFNNVKFPVLLEHLNTSMKIANPAPIFIDETGFEGPISITIPGNLLYLNNTTSSFNADPLKAILKANGLSLERAERPLDVIVFRDKE